MSGPTPVSVADRIARSVFITNSGCWSWMLYVKKNGYGTIGLSGRTLHVHRASYEAFVGPVPDEMDLDHKCHNEDLSCLGGFECLHRRCANPYHLEPVAHVDNILRGRNIKAARTHCKRGHEYTEENTYTGLSSNGRPYRRCKTCIQIYRHNGQTFSR